MSDVNNNNSSTNANKKPSGTHLRGFNVPTPKKKPPMPPVKSPKKNK